MQKHEAKQYVKKNFIEGYGCAVFVYNGERWVDFWRCKIFILDLNVCSCWGLLRDPYLVFDFTV